MRRATSPTRAPAAASASATTAPMPDEAPVTNADRPVKDTMPPNVTHPGPAGQGEAPPGPRIAR
ncbi:hypothetical protein GCM10009735_41640 [Actinomadura chokoriensis]